MTTYKDSGVDETASDAFIGYLNSKYSIDLGFAAEVDLSMYKQPVISLSTDGVGTKSKLLVEQNKYFHLGIDLVAAVFNDIICTGAQPIAMLDYIACPNLEAHRLTEFIKGIQWACRYCDAKLVGGETAQMNTINSLEVVGMGVGVREKANTFLPFDNNEVLVGIPASGFHANGYSLLRKLVDEGMEEPEGYLTPTRLYAPEVMALLRAGCKIKGIANITGGGLEANIERVIPEGFTHQIHWGDWELPVEYKYLNNYMSDYTMRETFNMGIGLVLMVDYDDARYINNGIYLGEIYRS